MIKKPSYSTAIGVDLEGYNLNGTVEFSSSQVQSESTIWQGFFKILTTEIIR